MVLYCIGGRGRRHYPPPSSASAPQLRAAAAVLAWPATNIEVQKAQMGAMETIASLVRAELEHEHEHEHETTMRKTDDDVAGDDGCNVKIAEDADNGEDADGGERRGLRTRLPVDSWSRSLAARG